MERASNPRLFKHLVKTSKPSSRPGLRQVMNENRTTFGRGLRDHRDRITSHDQIVGRGESGEVGVPAFAIPDEMLGAEFRLESLCHVFRRSPRLEDRQVDIASGRDPFQLRDQVFDIGLREGVVPVLSAE